MEIRLFQPQDTNRLAQLFHYTVREINIQDYTAEQVQAYAPENLHFRDWAAVCSDRLQYGAEAH
jgi:putative acetyltransferase